MSYNLHDPKQIGEWKVLPHKFNNLPVHVALLYTGKILTFGGSGNDPSKIKNWDRPEIFEPDYSGKTDGLLYEIDNHGVEGDLFCVGHASLSDGKLFLAGGTYRYDGLFGIPLPYPPFSGLEHSYVFDPENHTFTRLKNMKHGRWYPTCVMLSDGKIATFAGLSKYPPWVIQPSNEMYSPDTSSWEYIWGGHKFLPLYPRMHLLPNGELFYAGSYNTHMTFPFSLWGFKIGVLDFNKNRWKSLPHQKEFHRQEGSTVLLPLLLKDDYTAKVMLIGGGDMLANATNSVEIIQFPPIGKSNNVKLPEYVLNNPMHHKRYYVYTVILPDQNILVVGGKTGRGGHSMMHKCREINYGELEHDDDAVLEAELYDTKTKEWKRMAKMSVDRLYHANAILLPDGKVMTMGSNPMRKCVEKRIEFFSPPYLFKGERPKICEDLQKNLKYGMEFKIKLEKYQEIRTVSLIRPSNTTHCLNPEQRYVELYFKQESNSISAIVPKYENVLPPGYYMLFITNSDGVPCIAPFVHIAMKNK